MVTHLISTIQILVVCIVGMISPISVESIDDVLVVNSDILQGQNYTVQFALNGMMIGGYSDHEYGHHLQQSDMGNEEYYTTVAVPSLIFNVLMSIEPMESRFVRKAKYHRLPWEADANMRAMEYNK